MTTLVELRRKPWHRALKVFVIIGYVLNILTSLVIFGSQLLLSGHDFYLAIYLVVLGYVQYFSYILFRKLYYYIVLGSMNPVE